MTARAREAMCGYVVCGDRPGEHSAECDRRTLLYEDKLQKLDEVREIVEEFTGPKFWIMKQYGARLAGVSWLGRLVQEPKVSVARFYVDQATRSFPEGAPARENYTVEDEFRSACRLYDVEWRSAYDCRGESDDFACPQHRVLF